MPRRKRETWPGFGSVSSGTMRTEDLLSAFAPYCKQYGGKIGRRLAKEYANMTEEETLADDTDEIVSEMFECLDNICPPYVTFGANEGDGADYGFWPCIDALEDAVRVGEVLKVGDLSDIPSTYRGEVMLVTDHGNVTYGVAIQPNQYFRDGFREIWSCV